MMLSEQGGPKVGMGRLELPTPCRQMVTKPQVGGSEPASYGGGVTRI